MIIINEIFRKSRDEKGFTLVELLVVIGILAILAALAVPKFAQVLEDSKYKAHNQNVLRIYNAGQMYVSAHGNPVSAMDLQALAAAGYMDNAAIKTPYNGTAYTCSISTTGGVTVEPGVATKTDSSWDVGGPYTGGPIN